MGIVRDFFYIMIIVCVLCFIFNGFRSPKDDKSIQKTKETIEQIEKNGLIRGVVYKIWYRIEGKKEK